MSEGILAAIESDTIAITLINHRLRPKVVQLRLSEAAYGDEHLTAVKRLVL